MKFGDVNILGKWVGFEYDSTNTRGTIKLGSQIRINFGRAALANGGSKNYHTALSEVYGGTAILVDLTSIIGDERSGMSPSFSTTAVTWYVEAGYGTTNMSYVVVGTV
jgi:hypothetical protein